MQRRWATLYVNTLTELAARPGTFFATRFERVSTVQASGILALSALFSAVAGNLADPGNASIARGGILFANAVGMAWAGAGIGYSALAATARRRYSFLRLWNVFSLSSSVVLLIAWVPSAFFFTEPWKWWLIATGMVKGLGMSKARAVLVILFTFGAMAMLVCAFFSLAGLPGAAPV